VGVCVCAGAGLGAGAGAVAGPGPVPVSGAVAAAGADTTVEVYFILYSLPSFVFTEISFSMILYLTRHIFLPGRLQKNRLTAYFLFAAAARGFGVRPPDFARFRRHVTHHRPICRSMLGLVMNWEPVCLGNCEVR
jgi:hypothetical protein